MSSYYSRPLCSDELYHYGVVGMKWGQHKFSRKEIRSDNKRAFELGKKATITDQARKYSSKRLAKAQKKFDKAIANDPTKSKKSTQRKELNLQASKLSNKAVNSVHKEAMRDVSAHSKQLIKKYGAEHISDLKLDKNGRVNEKVISAKEWATAAGITAVGLASANVIGYGVVVAPYGKRSKGKTVANGSYQIARKSLSNKR